MDGRYFLWCKRYSKNWSTTEEKHRKWRFRGPWPYFFATVWSTKVNSRRSFDVKYNCLTFRVVNGQFVPKSVDWRREKRWSQAHGIKWSTTCQSSSTKLDLQEKPLRWGENLTFPLPILYFRIMGNSRQVRSSYDYLYILLMGLRTPELSFDLSEYRWFQPERWICSQKDTRRRFPPESPPAEGRPRSYDTTCLKHRAMSLTVWDQCGV